MKNALIVTSLCSLVSLAGCNSKPPSIIAKATNSYDYADLDDNDGRSWSDVQAGWTRLPEPFAYQSYLDYKLAPAEVVIGEPVQIEVHAGSSFGPITDVQIMVRTTSGSSLGEYGYLANAEAGKEWTNVTSEGIYVQVYQEEDDTEKEIRFEPDDSSHQQYAIENSGHTRFVASITPTDEEPIIELRWYSPEMEQERSLAEIADRAVQIHPIIETQ